MVEPSQNTNDPITDLKNKTKALEEAQKTLAEKVKNAQYYQQDLDALEKAREALIAAQAGLQTDKDNNAANEAKAAADKALSDTNTYLSSQNLANATRRGEAPVPPAAAAPASSSIDITPDTKPGVTQEKSGMTLKTRIENALKEDTHPLKDKGYTVVDHGDKKNAVVNGPDGKPAYIVTPRKITSTKPLDTKEAIKEALEIAKAATAPNEFVAKMPNATPEQQKMLEEAGKEVGVKTVAANAAPSPARQTHSQHKASSSPRHASAPKSRPSAAEGFASSEKKSSGHGSVPNAKVEELGYDNRLKIIRSQSVLQPDPDKPGTQKTVLEQRTYFFPKDYSERNENGQLRLKDEYLVEKSVNREIVRSNPGLKSEMIQAEKEEARLKHEYHYHYLQENVFDDDKEYGREWKKEHKELEEQADKHEKQMEAAEAKGKPKEKTPAKTANTAKDKHPEKPSAKNPEEPRRNTAS